MKSIYEFLYKKHATPAIVNQITTEDVFKLCDTNEFVIWVEKRTLGGDPVDPKWEASDIYIISYGDDTISERFGQTKYKTDWDIQDIEGSWEDKYPSLNKQNNVLKHLNKIAKIDCCVNVHDPCRKPEYYVHFTYFHYLCYEYNLSVSNAKIYDYSNK